MSITSSSSSTSSSSTKITEDSDASPCYDDPLVSSRALSELLQHFYQNENSKEPSKLLTKLFEDGNISHGGLTTFIPQEKLIKTKDMLLENFINRSTRSGTRKRDAKRKGGNVALTYENLGQWSPEIVRDVVDSILEIDYVKKENLHYNATLTKPYCLGTDHSDRMKFLARLIFTFLLLPDGDMTKQFAISHPKLSKGKQEVMAIGCHEFVVLDSKSSGSAKEWKSMKHQARAPGCEVLTFVISVHSENGVDLPPGITFAQFMDDLKNKTGGAFEFYDEDYYEDDTPTSMNSTPINNILQSPLSKKRSGKDISTTTDCSAKKKRRK